MNEHENHAIVLLEAANPVATDELRRELGRRGLDDARTRLDRRLDESAEADSLPDPVGPATRLSRRRRSRLAAAAAVCLAVGAIALVALPDGGGRLSAIDAAAAVAASQPPAVGADSGYTYLRVRQGGRIDPKPPGLVTAPSESTTEFWTAADGSGRIAETTSAHEGETPVGRGWRRSGGMWVRDVRFGPGRFSELYRRVSRSVLALDVDTLPTDADALGAVLRRELARAAEDRDPETGFVAGSAVSSGEMLIVIGQILAYPLAPPALRSALYELAATLEKVKVEEHAHDPSGRLATAIIVQETKSGTRNRYELFFDPESSATLATRFTTVERLAFGGSPRAPAPAAKPDRAERFDSPRSGCGTAKHPCPAKKLSSQRDPHARHVRITFTDFMIYDRPAIVDSVDVRP